MTAKEYLNQVRDVRQAITAEIERLQQMKEMAMSIGTKELKADRVQTSIKNEGLEGTVGNYVDYENKILDRVAEYREFEDKIVDEIHGMNCAYKLKYIIQMKYIDMRRLEDIANEMGYTYDHVRHLHGQALEVFAKQYREKLRGEVEWIR
jgi:DNA-directed RNA polymerase specialized sigma subunit